MFIPVMKKYKFYELSYNGKAELVVTVENRHILTPNAHQTNILRKCNFNMDFRFKIHQSFSMSHFVVFIYLISVPYTPKFWRQGYKRYNYLYCLYYKFPRRNPVLPFRVTSKNHKYCRLHDLHWFTIKTCFILEHNF